MLDRSSRSADPGAEQLQEDPQTVIVQSSCRLDDLAGLSPISPKARDLKRFFFNSSFDTELDSAHRVMVPQPLREYADLSQKVVVTGSGERLEVWAHDAYARYRADVLTRIPDIAASLGDTA